jgi:ribosomal protein S16
MNKYEDDFRKFAADQYSAWVTKGGQQTDNMTNLQEQKTRYDKLAA